LLSFTFSKIFVSKLLGDVNQPPVEDTKLSAVRLKLEEKRRHIEKEKRKIEAQMSKQLQKVGKAAFLQAINKRVRGD
jgi:Spectrin-binding region of Ca2+-Calmodulin